MRKLFGSLIALAALTGSAFAADLPVRKAAPLAPEYAVDWTGFTVGVVGGGGWAKAKPDLSLLGDFDFDGDMRGWVAGLYAGYNWQVGSYVVVGVEGDFTFADINKTQTLFQTVDLHTKVDRLASVRARVGFLITPNTLVYGTGGVGFGSAEAKVSFGEDVALTARQNQWGWVAGGGLEYSLGAKLKLRAEGLYYDLGKANYAFAPTPINVNSSLTVVVGRLGLGYQF